MNASAKTRRIVAATLVIGLVAAVGGGLAWVRLKLPARPGAVLATSHLAAPVELTDGDATHRVTRFVLDPAGGTLTLERDDLAFDDFGDATRTGGPDPVVVRVALRREGLSNHFEIAPRSKFGQRLRLVMPQRPATTARLIVLTADGTFDRILELRGPEIVPDELGDRPQPDRFSFGTLGRTTTRGTDPPRLHRIGVSGSLAGGGGLSIDPNYLGFAPDGSVQTSTLLGSTPAEVTFEPLGPDNTGRGRRAFGLVPKKTDSHGLTNGRSYVLVLGATELTEHRLVVKDGGTVIDVLALASTDRDNRSTRP